MEIVNETGLRLMVQGDHVRRPDISAVCILKGTFALVPGGACTPLPEAAQRPFCGTEPHLDDLGRTPRWLSDLAPCKPHTDFLVNGHFHAPGGVPVPHGRAAAHLGPMHKELLFFGERCWLIGDVISETVPTARVPLRWELAFGGLRDPRNPWGRGLAPEPDGIVRLPQIEDPAAPVQRRADRPEPANFAGMPEQFAERRARAGTRDHRWALFEAPFPPKDYDPSFHNTAPRGQRAGNHPRGDEGLRLVNLHPTVPDLATWLPGLRPRVALVRETGEAEEIAMPLDTVVALPDEDQLVLLWRGNAPARARHLPDVALVVATMERLSEEPAPTEAVTAAAAARWRAMQPADNAAETEAAIAAALGEARKLLEKVALPDEVRAVVESATDPQLVFDALVRHAQDELKRLGAPGF
ncbi:DUF2169 domain-containing protein [Roseomonas sp. NAR14]|uniref:DUF2169 domain-containing protein n=1 Tax=Roseomonas acroporae TaxID=2937791 RepID=A0A9X2BVU3_9PROT|nr:DUF2169 domain-containing protein [Roseomonas acroporae]MCK8784364.1 DUF2169 domain-containing protein [Roseomonas acroporae]